MCNGGTKPLCVCCLMGKRKVTAALAGATHTLAKHPGVGPTILLHANMADGVDRLVCPCAFPTAGQRDL